MNFLNYYYYNKNKFNMNKTRNKNNPFKLDNITINKSLIEKILKKEKSKEITLIDDLSELKSKSQSELLDVINQMMQYKNFFKYCYSLLININPGPEYVYDYLNLKDWITSESNIINNNKEKKPHLYSFLQYVYESMKAENKDQVVSLLGPLGSGKTFNLIHIMEYFTTLYSYPNYDFENFEVIHKSIQFMHILGSIFRENNLESSSCGLLLSLGFNQNNLICCFDIEAQILDFTLPFNEKGRTFSIFHALISGANENLKRKCGIWMHNDNLFNLKRSKKNNFYRNDKEKEKFKLNDLEIWNRFYSLLKYFCFTKKEMMDIINCLAFILNINELVITKVKGGKLKNIDYYEIQRGITTKKLCKNLGIKTDDKINELEEKIKEFKFKTLQDAEIFLQSLIKQTYYMIFEYALQKIKSYINEFFSKINKCNNLNYPKNKGKNLDQNIKFIYFIDFPGEVESSNLGGFTTNISHECLNMYSASAYYEIIEKILLENILLKKFKPLKSYALLTNCFIKGGIIDNFSNTLNEENYNNMKENILQNLNIYNCYKFPELRKSKEVDYNFYSSFSDKNVVYNYEYLYYESKSLLYNQKINSLLSFALNVVISSMLKNNQAKLNNFYNFFTSIISKFFNPIKNYKPFVVYCLHSNDSYKYFFSKKDENKFKKLNENNSEISLEIIKHSIIPAILNWNWHGFKEWIKIDDFLKEYANNFEKIKNRIVFINENTNIGNKYEDINIDFSKLTKNEKAKCILSILARDFDYILGSEYIFMKSGTLKRIAIYYNSMIDTAEEISKSYLYKGKIINTSSNKNNARKKLNIENGEKKNTKTKDELTNSSNSLSKKNSFKFDKNLEKCPLPKKKNIQKLDENIYNEKIDERRNHLKDQCSINIISLKNNDVKLHDDNEKNNVLKSRFLNISYILDKNKTKIKQDDVEKKDKFEELINYKDEKTKSNIPTKNNTVISDPVIFNKIKGLFDPVKSKNIKLFDYSDNIDLIIKIQTIFRGLEAQKKYRVLKYVTKYIILIQKFIRGLLGKKKMKFFLKCTRNACIIQRIYKKRYKKLNEKAKKIQDYYKAKKESKKERNKMILKKKLEEEKEKFSYIDIDKVVDSILKNKDEDVHSIVLNIGKTNTKGKIINSIKNKNDITQDLLKEKNKGRVIDLLLYSQMPGDDKVYRKKIKRSKSDFYKIEDKLIHDGEEMKKKREKKIKESKEKIDPNLIFYPKISKKVFEMTQKYPDDFLTRMEYYILFKKRNIENLRNKFSMNKINEMRFEPNIYYNQYHNIQSKAFDNKNYEKCRPFKYNNNEDQKQEDFLNPEKTITIRNNLKKGYYTFNGPTNLMANEDDSKNYNSIVENKNDNIWPKELYHRFFESQDLDNSNSNN